MFVRAALRQVCRHVQHHGRVLASLPASVSLSPAHQCSVPVPVWSTAAEAAAATHVFKQAMCTTSARDLAAMEVDAVDKLRTVIDECVGADVVTLGYIKDLAVDASSGTVSFTLRLDSPSVPNRLKLQADVREQLRTLPWVKSVDAGLDFMPRRSPSSSAPEGLKHVSRIIAVSSCKGGTGKSTVALNLACSLVRMGARVGLLDADVYGPSLPTMIAPGKEEELGVAQSEGGLIQPLYFAGINTMSYGFVAPKGEDGKRGSAVVRGPIVSNVVQQLANTTEWGELDYLLIDLPPGTGDINLTLCQSLPITAAVVVTTPHELSHVDVVKGIAMFDKLKVPTIALVENMSYFECDHGTRYFPFGKGHLEQLVKSYGFKVATSIPLNGDIARGSETGRPIVMDKWGSDLANLYTDLASGVVAELVRMRYAAGAGIASVSLQWNDQSSTLAVREFSVSGSSETVIPPALLRRKCRCAVCVDEFTGKQILREEDVSDDVVPTRIDVKGNYAVGVAWSDGHDSSIYTHEVLQSVAEQVREQGQA